MGRLCERPGCSERAALAYGMRPEECVFWLDVLREATSVETGVLCRRHGDTMVVPRGWTLDDLRDPDLHLFRPPDSAPASHVPSARRRRTTVTQDDTQQLELTGFGTEPARRAGERAGAVPPPASHPTATGDVVERWTPAFDEADDLDGLLSARSPLLSRAFRSAGPPD